MKRNDVLRGYRIVTEPTTAGGGLCQWAFAERDGDSFHIKQFLKPKFPLESTPGSAKGKAAKRKRCEAFERRHKQIMDATTAVSVGGGNLIVAVDLFREEHTYYKVTERIDGVGLPHPRSLSDKQRTVLLHTLVNSVEILHRERIVHGDLKPDNLLVRRTDRGLYSAKLIDFDDSYFVGDPPPAEEIVGDPTHYSPELLQYVKAGEDADRASLTTASDIFALGLIFHILLTGAYPINSDGGSAYPSEALLAGQSLLLNPALSTGHHALLGQMLDPQPTKRPSASEVIRGLKDIPRDDRPPAPATPPSAPPAGVLRTSGFKTKPAPVTKGGGPPARAPLPPTPPPPSAPTPERPATPPLRIGRGFNDKPLSR